MAGQYWFPSMSVDEIIESFKDWGISVSNELLLRPTSDFVLGIYVTCLEQVTHLTQDALQEPIQDALATLESPDMYSQALAHNFLLYHILPLMPNLPIHGTEYDDSLLERTLTARHEMSCKGTLLPAIPNVQRFASAAKIVDFSAKDISFPDPERTRSNFSAFINLVKFSEQRTTFITNLREKSASLTKERDQVARELAEVERQLDRIKEKLVEDEPQCNILKSDNDEITARLLAFREKQHALLEEVKTLKHQRAEIVQRKESIQNEVEQMSDTISRTRGRIVQSPERIKRNIVAMGTTATEDKRTLAAHEGKIRDLQTKISALLAIEKDVRSCVEQLQVVEKEMQALDGVKKNLSDIKDQLSEKKGERSELLLKRERVHKQFTNAQEKLERAQRHAEDKRIASHQTIERLQREYEEMAVERRDNDRQVEELRSAADEVERKMAEHMKQSQLEMNELLTEYWKLRHATEIYMETLANKLGMQVTSV